MMLRWTITLLTVISIAGSRAMAEFPFPLTSDIIIGCKADRALDGNGSYKVAAAIVRDKPDIGVAMGYCAGWVHQAMQKACFPNEASSDDMMMVIDKYADKHPDLSSYSFDAIAEQAIDDYWGCK